MRQLANLCKTVVLPLLIGVLMSISAGELDAQVDEQDQLEGEFQIAAKQILAKLRTDGIETTGVLKFSVRVGSGPFPKTVGALNMRLAEKLEVALAMANDASKPESHIGIVRGASDIANTIAGADHLNSDGREQLFSRKYPLAWEFNGQTEAVPDSMVIGFAAIRDDLSEMNIQLLLVTKSTATAEPTALADFTVPTDVEDLMEAGESFSTRGIVVKGRARNSSKAVKQIRTKALAIRNETLGKTKPQKSRHHVLSPGGDTPINFEIWYDNQIQPVEFRDGCAFVKEPHEGQKVMFVVRRNSSNGSDKSRYGVLIRLNGENTLYRQRIPDARAAIWILEPNSKTFTIRGFQIDKHTRQEFKVLSQKESSDRAIDYGRDVGMISVVVFKEETTASPEMTDAELDRKVQAQATLPSKTLASRGKLGKSLFDQMVAQTSTRGLIVEGEKEASTIKTTKFKRDSIPVMATSIRYYGN